MRNRTGRARGLPSSQNPTIPWQLLTAPATLMLRGWRTGTASGNSKTKGEHLTAYGNAQQWLSTRLCRGRRYNLEGSVVWGRGFLAACLTGLLWSRYTARRRLRSCLGPGISGHGLLPEAIAFLAGAHWVPSLFFGHWPECGMSEPAHPASAQREHRKGAARNRAQDTSHRPQSGRHHHPLGCQPAAGRYRIRNHLRFTLPWHRGSSYRPPCRRVRAQAHFERARPQSAARLLHRTLHVQLSGFPAPQDAALDV